MRRAIPFYSLLFRVMIGGVLIYAGFLKAVSPTAEFAAVLAAYKILPPGWISYAAIIFPYIEMGVGLYVLFGLFSRSAALAAAVLFGFFFIAIVSTFIRGIDLVSCGCFGENSLSPHFMAVLDIVLVGMSLLLYYFNKYPQPLTLDDFLS